MSWLRVKVGCWLLGPLLREEIRLASSQDQGDRYWRGRRTGALRIYQALVTRDELIALKKEKGHRG
jgi:hypothetical protein